MEGRGTFVDLTRTLTIPLLLRDRCSGTVDMDRSQLPMLATFNDVLPLVVARDAKQHFVQRCEDRTIILKHDVGNKLIQSALIDAFKTE